MFILDAPRITQPPVQVTVPFVFATPSGRHVHSDINSTSLGKIQPHCSHTRILFTHLICRPMSIAKHPQHCSICSRLFSDSIFFCLASTAEAFHRHVKQSIDVLNSCFNVRSVESCLSDKQVTDSMMVSLVNCHYVDVLVFNVVYDNVACSIWEQRYEILSHIHCFL